MRNDQTLHQYFFSKSRPVPDETVDRGWKKPLPDDEAGGAARVVASSVTVQEMIDRRTKRKAAASSKS